jgi:uncharacterized protein
MPQLSHIITFWAKPAKMEICEVYIPMISKEAVQSVCDQIAEKFNPEQIILFGSYAYGNPHEGSDIDLLVILPFEGRGFYKALEILKSIYRPFGIDLLARTPEDTERRYREGDPLICEALNKGKVLYRGSGPRVAS